MNEPSVFNPSDYLILAVDDATLNLKVLQGLLSPAGYKVTFATGGKQVLKRVEGVKPDLILLDWMMPEMSGLEVCQCLKQSAETSHIPVIILTASHELEHLMQAFECGAVDYMTKPFRRDELLARVRTHLELNQLRKQAQVQAAWEGILRQIVQDIHASINLQDILDTTVQAIQRFLKADRVMVYRWCDPQGCELMAIAGNEAEPTICLHQTGCLHLEGNPYPMPMVEQQEIALAEPSTIDTDDHFGQIHEELRLPIYQNELLWGGLVVRHSRLFPGWMQSEKEMLSLIAQQLAISIQHAGLHQRLREVNQELHRLSNTDGLTQVSNRRCFDHRLAQEWQRSQREQQPISLILCDIDYFKQFNDTYGHPSGDTCLVAVAQALQQCLKRPADFLARYGGEEFVVILPNTDLKGAIDVTHQMQRAVADLAIPHMAHPTSAQVTLSFGITSVIPEFLTDTQDILNRTDQALYDAKRAGRDRYAIAPSVPS